MAKKKGPKNEKLKDKDKRKLAARAKQKLEAQPKRQIEKSTYVLHNEVLTPDMGW